MAATAASRCAIAGVAHVVDQRPGAVERGGAQIVLVPAHRIAGGIAHRAIDALDGGIGGDARRRSSARSARSASLRASCSARTRPWPAATSRRTAAMSQARSLMIGRLASGPISSLPVLHHLRGVRAAGPARAAVDGHGAAAAHADAAGEAVGQRGIGVALHPGDDVEHGLVVALRHGVDLVAAVGLAAPERNLDGAVHCRYLTVTRTRCTALLPKPPASQRGSQRLRLAVGVGRPAGQARARPARAST